ncbi:hypothetical protein MNBD_ACTINO02-1390 [hydrothermal vent metagenome]|uniref:Uncharacterized protein n=1 Tax=hydrothermal vent metagenome TaxID=652676 RepID=A0A3B0SNI6_9ZZZZ
MQTCDWWVLLLPAATPNRFVGKPAIRLQVLEPIESVVRFNGMGKATVLVVAASLVLASCAAGTETTASIPPTTSATTLVTPPVVATTTTTVVPVSTTSVPTTTTTEPPQPKIDVALVAEARYLVTEWRGEDTVLATDQGEIVSRWVDDIVRPGGVTNDGHGGIVWAEGEKLWWLPAGAPTPQPVRHVGEIWSVSRAPLADNPAVRIGANVLDLVTGKVTESPADSWDELRAANGLLARIVEAETHRDSEGFIDQIIEPAHLQVVQDGSILFDVVVGGGVSEDFVTIEDFDGRRLIIKRIPEEPANATETFILFDLADGTVVERWRGALSTAALVGNQMAAIPDVVTPDMTQLCSTWTGTTTVVPQSGLSPFIQRARTSILAALQTCDFTALGWLGSGAPADAAEWESAMFATLEETLTMPFAETEGDFVWPKWAGVASVDELTAGDLELMRSRYEADPQDVVGSPDQNGIVIVRVDKTTARPMLLLPAGC